MNAKQRFPTAGELWRSVMRVFSPEVDPLLVMAAFLVVLFLGVLTNWLYGWASTLGNDTTGTNHLALVTVLLTLGIATVAVLIIRFMRLRGGRNLTLVETSPASHAGLIYVLSLQIDTALIAIKQHAPILNHCWVIYTKDDARLKDVYERLRTQVKDAGIVLQWHPVEIEADPVTHKAKSHSVYEALRGILTGDLPEGLAPEHIITDITGGTRPISAAAALACGMLKVSLEYVDSDYDPVTNHRIPGTERLVSVEWE